jgi:hypothetical protein
MRITIHGSPISIASIANTNAFQMLSDDALQETSVLVGVRAGEQFLELDHDEIKGTMATIGLKPEKSQ